MKVKNKETGVIYQVYGVSGAGFSRWIHRSSKIDSYLIWSHGYKWVDAEYFEKVQQQDVIKDIDSSISYLQQEIERLQSEKILLQGK